MLVLGLKVKASIATHRVRLNAFSAGKMFSKMNPGRLILGCRSLARGEAAVKGLDPPKFIIF